MRRLTFSTLALAAPLAIGCGSSETHNVDTGMPEPPSTFLVPGEDGGPGNAPEPPPTPPGVFDWRDSMIYFVFVDRFFRDPTTSGAAKKCGPTPGADGPGDYYGGNWAGVTAKIDGGYFNDLGVDTLWVTVPFKNADTVSGHGVGGDTHNYSAYHGYWPLDPTKTEDCFGTAADLGALVSAAHAKGLRVLFDYAMVHVHTSSPIFAQHGDWFWPNSKNGSPDCICKNKGDQGAYCNWDDDYQRCWFADYLPHWNYTNAAARDFSVAAAIQLAKDTHVDGYRLDAIKHVDDTWLTELRSQLTAQIVPLQTPPQRFYLVGETYVFDNRDFIKSFVAPSAKLDGQFDFPLRLNVVKSIVMRQGGYGLDQLAGFMDSNDGYYGADAVMSTFIGNHDMGRIIHMAEDKPHWDEYDNGSKGDAWGARPGLPASRSPFERVANAYTVLFTTKGAPLVYYGDEIGLPGAGDPDNRRQMQFDNLTADQQFLRDRLKTLTSIRAAHPALRRGSRTTLKASADVWTYQMKTTDDVVYVAVNRSDAAQTADGLPPGTLKELVTGTTVTGPSLPLPPRQARVLVP
jgi:glycosidase